MHRHDYTRYTGHHYPSQLIRAFLHTLYIGVSRFRKVSLLVSLLL